ncbi:unnamed protein product [Rotaria sordida]|uniref:alpha-L-fucosidase n=1 Tax=Rotaria sordida TaxID=392033 RepID=A0A815BTC9_9BILA|nr:unnamed protein product [Rotaria sordida]
MDNVNNTSNNGEEDTELIISSLFTDMVTEVLLMHQQHLAKLNRGRVRRCREPKIDKHSCGYIRTSGVNDYLTIQEILYQIITTVSTGGNVLINVGPTSYGKISPIYEERLRQMGSWLKVNGEAIYNSIPWKYQNDTINKNVCFSLSFQKNTIELILGAPISSSNTSITLLGSDVGSLSWRSAGTSGGIVIELSNIKICSLASNWAWVFKLQNVTPKQTNEK